MKAINGIKENGEQRQSRVRKGGGARENNLNEIGKSQVVLLHAINVHGGAEVQLHSSMTLTLWR